MEMTEYVYLCAAGETFDGIARDLWQNEKYAADLMCANPEYCGQAVFSGGERLYIPVVDTGRNTAEEPEKAPWKE